MQCGPNRREVNFALPLLTLLQRLFFSFWLGLTASSWQKFLIKFLRNSRLVAIRIVTLLKKS